MGISHWIHPEGIVAFPPAAPLPSTSPRPHQLTTFEDPFCTHPVAQAKKHLRIPVIQCITKSKFTLSREPWSKPRSLQSHCFISLLTDFPDCILVRVPISLSHSRWGFLTHKSERVTSLLGSFPPFHLGENWCLLHFLGHVTWSGLQWPCTLCWVCPPALSHREPPFPHPYSTPSRKPHLPLQRWLFPSTLYLNNFSLPFFPPFLKTDESERWSMTPSSKNRFFCYVHAALSPNNTYPEYRSQIINSCVQRCSFFLKWTFIL